MGFPKATSLVHAAGEEEVSFQLLLVLPLPPPPPRQSPTRLTCWAGSISPPSPSSLPTYLSLPQHSQSLMTRGVPLRVLKSATEKFPKNGSASKLASDGWNSGRGVLLS